MMSTLRDALAGAHAVAAAGGDLLDVIDFSWAAAHCAQCALGRSVVAVRARAAAVPAATAAQAW